MSKKILVTGACGYIGTLLTQKLLEAGHHVVGVDTMWFGNVLKPHANLTLVQADIRDVDKIPMEGIEVILHLGNIANDPTGDLDSKLTWEVNVLAGKLLVEKAIKNKVKHFVFASSGSVYGVKDEPQVTEELDLVPISDYNKTKMICERVLLSYKDEIIVTCIRPATVCGFTDRTRLDLSVNMLTMQGIKNKRITVFGGDQTRPNIHVQDMVRVYFHVLDQGAKIAGVYNAGFENISILEIANRVVEHTGAEVVVSPSNDPRSYRLNSDKLLKTGFSPKFKVNDAIQEIIAAYKDGRLVDDEKYYNVKMMVKLGIRS